MFISVLEGSTVAARGPKARSLLVVRGSAVVMEGVTVGQVFDAECILSKRPRKVRTEQFLLRGHTSSARTRFVCLSDVSSPLSQGKFEYLVKWRGWSSK